MRRDSPIREAWMLLSLFHDLFVWLQDVSCLFYFRLFFRVSDCHSWFFVIHCFFLVFLLCLLQLPHQQIRVPTSSATSEPSVTMESASVRLTARRTWFNLFVFSYPWLHPLPPPILLFMYYLTNHFQPSVRWEQMPVRTSLTSMLTPSFTETALKTLIVIPITRMKEMMSKTPVNPSHLTKTIESSFPPSLRETKTTMKKTKKRLQKEKTTSKDLEMMVTQLGMKMTTTMERKKIKKLMLMKSQSRKKVLQEAKSAIIIMKRVKRMT